MRVTSSPTSTECSSTLVAHTGPRPYQPPYDQPTGSGGSTLLHVGRSARMASQLLAEPQSLRFSLAPAAGPARLTTGSPAERVSLYCASLENLPRPHHDRHRREPRAAPTTVRFDGAQATVHGPEGLSELPAACRQRRSWRVRQEAFPPAATYARFTSCERAAILGY